MGGVWKWIDTGKIQLLRSVFVCESVLGSPKKLKRFGSRRWKGCPASHFWVWETFWETNCLWRSRIGARIAKKRTYFLLPYTHTHTHLLSIWNSCAFGFWEIIFTNPSPNGFWATSGQKSKKHQNIHLLGFLQVRLHLALFLRFELFQFGEQVFKLFWKAARFWDALDTLECRRRWGQNLRTRTLRNRDVRLAKLRYTKGTTSRVHRTRFYNYWFTCTTNTGGLNSITVHSQ